MDGVGNPTAPSQQTADLLRQRLIDDVPTWAVAAAWEARAARVCCDIPKEEVSTQHAQAGPDGQGEQALALGWLTPMEYEKRHTTNVA